MKLLSTLSSHDKKIFSYPIQDIIEIKHQVKGNTLSIEKPSLVVDKYNKPLSALIEKLKERSKKNLRIRNPTQNNTSHNIETLLSTNSSINKKKIESLTKQKIGVRSSTANMPTIHKKTESRFLSKLKSTNKIKLNQEDNIYEAYLNNIAAPKHKKKKLKSLENLNFVAANQIDFEIFDVGFGLKTINMISPKEKPLPDKLIKRLDPISTNALGDAHNNIHTNLPHIIKNSGNKKQETINTLPDDKFDPVKNEKIRDIGLVMNKLKKYGRSKERIHTSYLELRRKGWFNS